MTVSVFLSDLSSGFLNRLKMIPVDVETFSTVDNPLPICSLCSVTSVYVAGWEEERSGPTGKSFRFVRACVRAVIVKWK